MVAYKRILLKISGEAIAGDKKHGIDVETIGRICDKIARPIIKMKIIENADKTNFFLFAIIISLSLFLYLHFYFLNI